MKTFVLSLLENAIGKDKAVTKQEICRQTNLSERAVRLLIAELRDEGYLILSSSKVKGYYLPSEKNEAEHFVREMEKRGRNCFSAASFARAWIKQNEDQLTLL